MEKYKILVLLTKLLGNNLEKLIPDPFALTLGGPNWCNKAFHSYTTALDSPVQRCLTVVVLAAYIHPFFLEQQLNHSPCSFFYISLNIHQFYKLVKFNSQ